MALLIPLGYGYPPLEFEKKERRNGDRENGAFSAERCFTYTRGKRFLSLNIRENGYAGRVNAVHLNLEERNGRGSSAYIYVHVKRDGRYGVRYNINNSLRGSFDSFKENYWLPTSPEAEIIWYFCPETGAGSFFSVERKKNDMDYVDKVKATHAFRIDGELTVNVSINITDDINAGLRVDVEGPLKHTLDSTKQLIYSIRGEMRSQMTARPRLET